MKSQWECVLENLGEWVGSFTTVTAGGESIEDIPSIIKLEGSRDNRSVHLVLTRFYPLPNSTERYPKEVVWNFSTPPGIGAIYFETGAFSSGALAVFAGVKTIAEFSLRAADRRFRTIETFDIDGKLDRVTFVREQRQGTIAPERPHLTINDLVGTWTGTATTFYPQLAPIVTQTATTFTASATGYQLVTDEDSIDLRVANQRLLFATARSGESYQMLLLPDGSYTTTPTQIRLGCPFELEIGWMYQPGQRQRLVRRYDSAGQWHSATLICDEFGRS
ncbi:DUF3598 family protein [Chamaesiphon sp. OTE_20_metabat_361]|uniref:DUF3598 family protein n=1 Tax=Chamaesiphon sp. OTE_20_metabat_361 TaxID=2964689 RepID=UPI00286A798E|nr:DUF3598 family protein [Chamaesiphon sp. OTE_20_metabat_361]